MLVQSVTKALKVLDIFSPEHPEWGVSEAARSLGMAKSTTHMMMNSLADQGLLYRTERKRYRLGWRLFELSQTLLDTIEWRVEARRVMEGLVATQRETTHLAVLDDVQVVYLEKLQPVPAVKITASRIGARLPAHCSGVGKVLLASCEWEWVARAFEHQGLAALTPNTITSLDELEIELDRVRDRGYAFDEEEVSIGLCCAAAPIFDCNGEVLAAISLSVPAFRFYDGRDKYLEAILEAAGRVSRSMGYWPDRHGIPSTTVPTR